MPDIETFYLRPEHIALLQRAYVRWENCEFGAPAIDCKRPYGNSSVYWDIAEILNIQPDDAENDDFSDVQRDFMERLHKGTETALQIFLRTGKMEPGLYQTRGYSTDWERVGD